MGKAKKKDPNRKSSPSSGTRHQSRARQQISRLRMKIKRWERYITEDRKSKNRTWDTTGLTKQMEMYEKIMKQPAKR